jgi:hypothetical protein
LKKVSNILDRKVLLNLYNTFILPYLSYCISIWGNAANTYLLRILLLPDSAFLRHLNAQPAPERVEVTSIVAGRDLLIQPVDSAICPFGESVVFDDLGHVELLFRPRVFSEIAGRLAHADRPTPLLPIDLQPSGR